MRGILIALCVAFALYSVAVYRQGGGTDGSPADSRVRAGMEAWQGNNCQSCHQFYGLGGYMGPDLMSLLNAMNNAFGRSSAMVQGECPHMILAMRTWTPLWPF